MERRRKISSERHAGIPPGRRREDPARRWRARWLALCLASIVGTTGFATCGGGAPDDETAEEEEGAGEATIEEEQEDMYRDIDR